MSWLCYNYHHCRHCCKVWATNHTWYVTDRMEIVKWFLLTFVDIFSLLLISDISGKHSFLVFSETFQYPVTNLTNTFNHHLLGLRLGFCVPIWAVEKTKVTFLLIIFFSNFGNFSPRSITYMIFLHLFISAMLLPLQSTVWDCICLNEFQADLALPINFLPGQVEVG